MKHAFYRIKNFFFHFNRAFQLWKMGWKDYDWDYGFLIDLEYQKLIWMRDYFKSSDITPKDKEVARDIELTIKMLDIIKENNSAIKLVDINAPIGKADFIQTRYVNTKNWRRFLADSDTFRKNINGSNSFGNICRDTLRIEKAWKLYNRIREEKLRIWWD